MRMRNQYLLFLFLCFLVTTFFIPFSPSYLIDIDFWTRWSEYIYINGVSNIYKEVSDCNYPPIFLYILKGYASLIGEYAGIKENISYIKIAPLIFDYLPLVFAFVYLPFLELNIKKSLLLIANIAYLYNTILWGQIDAIHTAFIFMSLSSFYIRETTIGILFYVLSLCVKVQSVVYAPIIFVVMLCNIKYAGFRKEISKGILVSFIVVLLLFLPFILGSGVGLVFSPYTKAVGFYKVLSFNAFNFWYFITPYAHQVQDVHEFLGLSFHSWGIGLYSVSFLLAVMPICLVTLGKFKNMNVRFFSFDLMILTVICITLVFFYFNTQMHERYSHPILLFSFFYALASKRWKIYILSSIGYFINLEGVCKSISGGAEFHLGQPMKFIDNPVFGLQYSNELIGSLLFTILTIISFWELYSYYYEQKNAIETIRNYLPVFASKSP